MNKPTRSRETSCQPAASFAPGPRLSGSWRTAVICILLTLSVWFVFGQTIRHDFVNYDDGGYVYENPTVARGLTLRGIVWAFTHSHGGNWHPLTSLSHMLDCQLYGLNPGGHHLTNVCLHVTTGLLLFFLLRNLTGAFWRSAFVAAVFLLHPLRVESVAWIAERKDVLSGLFFVLTLGAYVRFARLVEASHEKSAGSRSSAGLRSLVSKGYALVLLLFTLGLMSKPILVTVPVVMLLLDYWPLRRLSSEAQSVRRLVVEKIPFLLLSAASGAATVLAQEGAIQSFQTVTVLSRIENALVAYVVYLGQMLYPFGLAVFYPHPGDRLSVTTAGLCALVLMIISAGVMRWRQERPYLLTGWLWYLVMLLPVIGLVQAGVQARADRYTYLPQIGLYLMVAWGAGDWCRNWRWRRVALQVGAVTVLAGLMKLAHSQTTHWRDSFSLWSHTLACTPGNSLAHHSLGLALADQAKWEEAIRHYELALQLNPDYAKAHSNLGNALFARGRWREAVQHYERALQLKPDLAEAWYNWGNVLFIQGNRPEAIQRYERAIQLRPHYAQAFSSLGDALAASGKLNDAIGHYQRALKLNPAYASAHNSLGIALTRQGRLDEAIPHYEQALASKPAYVEAHYNLGVALDAKGRTHDAIQHYQRAIQIKPDHSKAHNNLGATLAEQGRLEEALRHYEQALRIQPDFAEAHGNLGIALVRQGKLTEARQRLQHALQLALSETNTALAEGIRTRLQSIQTPFPSSPP